jgi:hypothetical protein
MVGFACDDHEMGRGWQDSDRIGHFERWRDPVGLVIVVAFGPSVLESATSDLSAWNWFTTVLWVVAVLWFAYSTVAAPRTRHAPPKVYLSPTDVPVQDVQRIVRSVTERVPAVKALRDNHPGLTLKDAVDLVDAAREANRPGTGPSSGGDQ